MKNNRYLERIWNGIWTENPLFVLVLGTCPTLAVTTSATNGLGMGVAATAVLVLSNILISALRNIIPGKVRLPAEIVVVASLVTICDMLMEAFTPSLYEALGLFIPLIVVNCIILGRAEAFALKNDPVISAFDGLGMGLGFTIALVLIGAFREVLGAGTIFGLSVMPSGYRPISIFILAPGAFIVFAMLTALQNKLKLPCATNGDAEDPDHVMCDGNCSMCRLGMKEAAAAATPAAAPKAKTEAPAKPEAEAEKDKAVENRKEAVKDMAGSVVKDAVQFKAEHPDGSPVAKVIKAVVKD